MARPAARPFVRSTVSVRVSKRSRPQLRASQARASGIVLRFLAISFVWIVVSSAVLSLAPVYVAKLKPALDVAYLAYATFTLHARVLRALAAAEKYDLAYREVSVELIERLSNVGEHRDDLTGGHARRIGGYSGAVARALGLDPEECERLELAATLHDLGKVGIPDAILNKTAPLTAKERDEMMTHVEIGSRILEGGSHPLLQTAHQVALTHHENWDGTGYPQGLRGEQIPLCGRIVAVCDVYDALVTARPYKDAWTVEDALAEIARLCGTKFDPQVVDAFMRCQSVGLDARRPVSKTRVR